MVDEAITEFQHAIALNPEAGYAYLQLAFLYTIRGRYDRAEAVSKQAIELQERFISGREGLQVVGAHTRLGYAYYRQGRYDEAIAEYEKELGFLASSDHGLRDRTLVELDEKMGATYLRKGMKEEAEGHFIRALKRFDERVTRGADDPHTKYYIASLHALRGDNDRALKYLAESSAHLKTINALRAKTDPDFETLRDDPRFKEIVGE
jgi:tetratricopeptide (TPR) repeat protein